MKRLLSIIISVIIILTTVPVLAQQVSLSSNFEGLVGVPVCADIPLDFSIPVSLIKTDVSISPEIPFEIEGSDTSYVINFAEDMLFGNLYTISTPYGSISYQTAYGTEQAKIPTNTPAGAGRSVALSEDVSEFTMKIDFMSYTELPLNKWIKLYDDLTENIGILVSNDGGHIILGLHRWDVATNTWRGPAVTASQLNVDFSDVAYLTVKDNNARIFVVSKDGTVTCGNNWNFSASSIANCKFDAVSIDSILFGVEIGNSIGSPNVEGGGGSDSGSDSDSDADSDSNIDQNDGIVMDCSINGAEFVPTSGSIPVTFNKKIILMQSDISITADGQAVTEFSLDTDDDMNYIITINGGMKERLDYKIVVNSDVAPELADKPIEFSTSYVTNKESMVVRSDGNEQALSRSVEHLTMFAEVTEATYSVNSYKYATWYDISDNDDKSLKSEKYIEFMMSRTSADSKGYMLSAFIKNGEADTRHQVVLVPQNTIQLNGSSPIVTLKDGMLYIYSTNNDNSVTYYGAKDISSFISDFKVGSIGGRGTNYLTIHTGYGEQLSAKVIQSGAESDDRIKIEFSTDIVSYPEQTTITDGKISATADVEISGNTAILALNGDLNYNSVFEIDLSEFKDRLGENAEKIEFETTPAPKFYRADNAVFMINGTETTALSSGLLTVSMPVKRLRKSKYSSVAMVVAIYKRVDGKQYLYDIKKVASADFEVGDMKTLVSETAINVPTLNAGEDYYAKVFLYPANGGLFSLAASQLLN